jgi:hypothetical protein
MILRDVLLAVFFLVTLLSFPLVLMRSLPGPRLRPGIAPLICASFILILYTFGLWFRSLDFGVDTAAYSDLFKEYCHGQGLGDSQLSYKLSIYLIDAGMLGACRIDYLPGVWGGLVIAPLLLMREPIKMRLSFAAILIFSLVGIELTTNALRQGLSVSVCMLAISFGRKRWILALPLFGISMLLHTSMILVLVLLGFSMMSWKRFLFVMGGATLLVTYSIQSGVEPEFLWPFLYEIKKYIKHDDDELWVRVLGFACILGALASSMLPPRQRCAQSSSVHIQIALKIGVACLPFLVLPFFGYRIVYGIFPMVLYFTLIHGREKGIPLGYQFGLLISFNMAILFSWAHGSGFMRGVPFF